jgi:outer membrane biosynthesis protein TonB
MLGEDMALVFAKIHSINNILNKPPEPAPEPKPVEVREEPKVKEPEKEEIIEKPKKYTRAEVRNLVYNHIKTASSTTKEVTAALNLGGANQKIRDALKFLNEKKLIVRDDMSKKYSIP